MGQGATGMEGEPSMTRRMYDSTDPSAIPFDGELVAGYVDGRYAWSPVQWATFPRKVHVPIAVFASTDDGIVLDVERWDATPQQAPDWVLMRRAAGVDPTVYCAFDSWFTVRNAFSVRGVAQPHWWIADYDNVQVIYPDTVAKQYQSTAGYDLSIVADYWPGVDAVAPAPVPQPLPIRQPTREEEMQAIIVNGLLTVVAAGQDGHLLQFTREADGWHVDDVTDAIKMANPNDPTTYLVAP